MAGNFRGMVHAMCVDDAPVCAHSALAAVPILACTAAESMADTYDPSNHQLTIATAMIGSAVYSNLVVTVGSVVNSGSGSAPYGIGDTYDPASGQLTVPSVTVGSAVYYNVILTVSRLESIGSVAGMDSYDGAKLSIPAVLVQGGALYTNVVVTVARIDGVAGAMPAAVQNEYSTAANQLRTFPRSSMAAGSTPMRSSPSGSSYRWAAPSSRIRSSFLQRNAELAAARIARIRTAA